MFSIQTPAVPQQPVSKDKYFGHGLANIQGVNFTGGSKPTRQSPHPILIRDINTISFV